MRVALDSNILAYLAKVERHPHDEAKIATVTAMVKSLANAHDFVAPVQALGELFIVLRRDGTDRADARAIVNSFATSFSLASTGATTLSDGLALAVEHKLQFWDSLIVAASVEAGCAMLLSEDMQDGFVWRGLTVVNPLAAMPHAKLQAMIAAV